MNFSDGSNTAPDAAEHRILIAGMHGFIGTHIAVAALRRGVQVVGVSLDPDIKRTRRLHDELGLGGITSVAGDATDSGFLAAVIADHAPNTVINAVGSIRSSSPSWIGGYSANIATAMATTDALAATEPAHRPFLLWIGSQAEYGQAPSPWREDTREQPASAYGVSKLAATALVLAAQRSGELNGAVVRLPIVFGPAQTPALFVAAAINSALSDSPFEMTKGEQKRRFAYASDVGDVLVELALIAGKEAIPPLINAPARQPTTIREIAQVLVSLMPDRRQPLIGALPYRSEERMNAWPDTSLAESLGLLARTPLESALRQTVEWYERNSWFLEGEQNE